MNCKKNHVKLNIIKPRSNKIFIIGALLLIFGILVLPQNSNGYFKLVTNNNSTNESINRFSVSTSYSNSLTINFEKNIGQWAPFLTSSGANLALATTVSYQGNDTARLSGTATYLYSFSNNNTEIDLTNNTLVTVAWNFASTAINYVGMEFWTSPFQHSIFIMSWFSGTYINNSNYQIIQYAGESPNRWYTHTVNLSAVFLQAYGTIPHSLIGITLINAYGLPLNPSSEITYFGKVFFSGVNVRNQVLLPLRINQSTQNTYMSGTTGHIINWTGIDFNNGTDHNSATYIIYRNNVRFVSGNWHSGVPIIINIDGLVTGTYIYKCQFYDAYNLTSSSLITVTVSPNQLSTLSTPSFNLILVISFSIFILIIIIIGIVLLFRKNTTKIVSSKTIENEIDLQKELKTTTGSAFCPACGASVLPNDQYCMSCGTKLNE